MQVLYTRGGLFPVLQITRQLSYTTFSLPVSIVSSSELVYKKVLQGRLSFILTRPETTS